MPIFIDPLNKSEEIINEDIDESKETNSFKNIAKAVYKTADKKEVKDLKIDFSSDSIFSWDSDMHDPPDASLNLITKMSDAVFAEAKKHGWVEKKDKHQIISDVLMKNGYMLYYAGDNDGGLVAIDKQ